MRLNLTLVAALAALFIAPVKADPHHADSRTAQCASYFNTMGKRDKARAIMNGLLQGQTDENAEKLKQVFYLHQGYYYGAIDAEGHSKAKTRIASLIKRKCGQVK